MSDVDENVGSSKERIAGGLIGALADRRAFARSLRRDRVLVQEATVRAVTAAHQFQPGTNFKAWIFTTLRHQFYNETRHNMRYGELPENFLEVADRRGQESSLELYDVRRALWQLTPGNREVLTLIGLADLSYEDAAEVCGCAVGTAKSRVNRARLELRRIIANDEVAARQQDVEPATAALSLISFPRHADKGGSDLSR